MVKLKNVTQGMLLITDAQLRLSPGEVVEVDSLTPHAERALDLGRLAEVRASAQKEEVSDQAEPQPEGDSNLSDLTATEAISQIKTEDDAQKLKAHLGTEKRRTVLDVLKKRLEELGDGA